MASFFDGPKDYDDGAFIAIRFNDILPFNHPARYIKKFIENIDIERFKKKYAVGDGKKGRAPKDVKMMLGVILYALYCRIFSAHKIDYATYTYADFWIFTHKERISHDKISDFIICHEEDMMDIFIETIKLADENNLLNFEAIYQDGFLLKANASKKRSRNMKSLNKKEEKLSIILNELFERLKNQEEDQEVHKEVEKTQEEMTRIKSLKEELNKKIKQRTENKANHKVKEIEEKLTINESDKDSDLMKMKKGGFDNAYLKVSAIDSKADIVMGSVIDGYYNEVDKSVELFNKANANCKGLGKYKKCVADSGFNSKKNCEEYSKMDVQFISPTKQHESETRNPEKYKDAISFEYDRKKKLIICSEGAELKKEEEYFESKSNTKILRFWNKTACLNCLRKTECTKSKNGFRKVKIDVRSIYQEQVLAEYKSEQGQKLYKKRSHAGETFQGDLKQNGKFIQLFRRGINKVKVDSTFHDIIWNLRRIINTKMDSAMMLT